MSKVKNKNSKIKYSIGIFLIFISVLITSSIIWGNRTFSVKTLGQIIYHLKVPMSGTDKGIMWNWFIWCIPISFFVTIISTILFSYGYHWFNKKKFSYTNIKQQIHNKLQWVGIFFLVFSLAFVFVNYNVYGYFTNVMQRTDLYERYYVDPRSVNITFPDEKRNLIHIYLESIESTFVSQQSGGAYEIGYANELEDLANTHINFSHTNKIGGSMTVDGTQWTIAAMVAQSAGIPLMLPINVDSFEHDTLFLPGSYTIGEVLEKEGYQQQFLLGSDANFAGMSNFFSQHGNYDIVDYNKVKEQGRIPEDYFEFWGFEDEKLFSFAKEDLLQLAEGDQPFNMTIATVDAHTPEGYLSESCATNFDGQYENVIACQSTQVYEFINWVQQQDFYENTTIVIAADHNSMASWFFDLDSDYIRTPYNVIINSPIQPVEQKNRLFTAMDWYPTILASIGAEIEGERLGLGTNLFSDKPTLIEEKGFDYVYEEVQKTSDFYNKEIIGLKD